MNEQTIRLLWERHLRGEITPEEDRELFGQLASEQHRGLAGELIEGSFAKEEETSPLSAEKQQRILSKIFVREEYASHLIKRWRFVAAAAAVVLVFSAAGYFLLQSKQQTKRTVAFTRQDIPPGHNQATLLLANGKRILLTKGLNGILATQGNTTIQVSHDQVAYNHVNGKDMVSYNTLTTAQGEQSPYPLILADGTKVWLNAESSVEFPTVFSGKERLVKVSGEAYFEVNHNAAQPFKVQTESQIIEDIGTRFDVKAYHGEPAATTLVEGIVKVNGALIKPGEQFSHDQINAVSPGRYTAWKQGDFDFEGEPIQAVMKELSRWYAIDVVYQGTPPNTGFYAKISRSQNISTVLQALERTQGVHFHIDGRRVTVIQ